MITSIQDVKDKLIAEGIDADNIKDGTPVPDSFSGETIHRIYYIESSAEMDSKPKTIEVKEIEVEGGDNIFKYFGAIPPILRETPATQPERTQLETDANILSYITGKGYNLLKDDSFTVRVNGDEDIVTARIIDSKDDAVTTAQFVVYDDKGTVTIKEMK